MKIKDIEITDEYQAALDSIDKGSNQVIFITGDAGTGKSTFMALLERLLTRKKACYAKVAPTGISALNIKGCTIHKAFRFDFNNDKIPKNELTKEFVNSIDYLIIDEISMVRADLMDRIHRTLRSHSKGQISFGGKKLILIGDLFQLSPVVTREQPIIDYESPYFFSANIFKKVKIKMFQFTKVFRQEDAPFSKFLKRLRFGYVNNELIEKVNEKIVINSDYLASFKGVYLCALKSTAKMINDVEIEKIDKKEKAFEAEIEGDFPVSMMPSPQTLILKEGAKVILTKNTDFFTNGEVGTVSMFKDEEIVIKKDDGGTVLVPVETWHNFEYEGGDSKIIGSFKQYPVTLGWAITIHKSQGLTIDGDVIIHTGRGCFSPGHFYVAMSRVTKPEYVKLFNPLQMSDIIVSPHVVNFFKDMLIDKEPNGQLNLIPE
jgi:ATP-dependent exoDNAse (exonuclease V) alpha subunit